MIEIMENLEQLAEEMEVVAEKTLNYRGPKRNEVAVQGFQLQGMAELAWYWARGVKDGDHGKIVTPSVNTVNGKKTTGNHCLINRRSK